VKNRENRDARDRKLDILKNRLQSVSRTNHVVDDERPKPETANSGAGFSIFARSVDAANVPSGAIYGMSGAIG
jgi:hypothetical protein